MGYIKKVPDAPPHMQDSWITKAMEACWDIIKHPRTWSIASTVGGVALKASCPAVTYVKYGLWALSIMIELSPKLKEWTVAITVMFKHLLTDLWDGCKTTAKWLQKQVPELFDKLMDKTKEFLNRLKKIGGQIAKIVEEHPIASIIVGGSVLSAALGFLAGPVAGCITLGVTVVAATVSLAMSD